MNATERNPISESEDQELAGLIEVCNRAAEGDLEARVTHFDPDHPLGRLSASINHMLDMADSFVREAASAMRECSLDRFHRPILLRGLRGGYRQSSVTINQAGLKMQEHYGQLQSTARLAGNTARNVQEIAVACEELNATNGEVSRQAAESANLTESAVPQGAQARAAVEELQAAMKKIDTMLGLINKIAGQTNLLALNATIEAARAGEHGRGFAVVADEVKELSRSSAKAANDIAQQVASMRKLAEQTVGCIKSVNQSLLKMDSAASTIAAASKEQVQATGEISRNIAAASRNSQQISESIRGSQAASTTSDQPAALAP